MTHPWCWPEVQRGGERLFADLVRYLARAGHDVTAITTVGDPQRGGRSRDPDGATWIRHSSPARLPRLEPRQRAVAYLPLAAASIRRARADVVHGLYHLDGVAARLAGRPYVVHVQGMPSRRLLEARRVHRTLLPWSLGRAGRILAVSGAAAGALRSELGYAAEAVHNGVFTDEFMPPSGTERAERPTVLFPGDPKDRRKRVELVARAAERLAPAWPGLRLEIAAATDPQQARELRDIAGPNVEVAVLAVPRPQEMVEAYARAWVTCLPAPQEAFGLVFIESLAAGTPVVGVRDGGVPEVVAEPSWLAEPDDVDSVTAAVDRALRASAEPGCTERCRQLAAPFDWSARGPAFEDIYRAVVGS